MYMPTICPAALIPSTSEEVAPGTSMVLNVSVEADAAVAGSIGPRKIISKSLLTAPREAAAGVRLDGYAERAAGLQRLLNQRRGAIRAALFPIVLREVRCGFSCSASYTMPRQSILPRRRI